MVSDEQLNAYASFLSDNYSTLISPYIEKNRTAFEEFQKSYNAKRTQESRPVKRRKSRKTL